MTNIAQVIIVIKWEVVYGRASGILTFDLVSFKGQGQCHAYFDRV